MVRLRSLLDMRCLAGLALVALASGAAAQGLTEPAAGTFLVSKGIDGGPFHQSVVLLLKHGEDGSLGLIVNRPTGVRLAEALPELDVGETPHALYFGGPVALDGLLVLWRTRTPPPGVEEVLDGVCFSGDREVLEGLLKGELPGKDVRLFVGHAGWGAGQLAGELRRKSWDVVPADLFTLFQTEPEWMWETLTEGRTVALLDQLGPRILGVPREPQHPLRRKARPR